MYETDAPRGDIRHLDRYKQLISWSGLETPRKITPTDCEGLMDFGGIALINIELKLIDAPFHYGQKLAFQNMIDTYNEAGKKGCIILARHNSKPEEIIDGANCIVETIYVNKEWHSVKGKTVKDVLSYYIKKWRLDK